MASDTHSVDLTFIVNSMRQAIDPGPIIAREIQHALLDILPLLMRSVGDELASRSGGAVRVWLRGSVGYTPWATEKEYRDGKNVGRP